MVKKRPKRIIHYTEKPKRQFKDDSVERVGAWLFKSDEDLKED